MSEFKIEQGVPMPQARGAEMVYPFEKMEVGDSFYVEGKKGATINGAIQAYIRKEIIASGCTKKFACRSDAKGVRIWRIQ